MSGESERKNGSGSGDAGGSGMEPLRAGDPRVIGPYRLLGRLGSGGMGRVYLARSGGGRTVAVKVVHAEHAQDPQFRARFRREIASVRKVGEHYTAPVLDADPEADRPWVATGFVPGPSLEQVVREHGPLPADSVLALALGLLRALQGIHGAGILHRDLKPSNVMLTVEGPKVIDFGIARALEPSVESLLTSTGMVVGSPGFMAPEQVRGESLGPAADVFALGCVLMYAVTGRLPFGHGASNQHAIMFRIVEAEPELDRVESEALRAFLARCLIKDPAERPGIAALLADPALPGEESGRGPVAGGAWLPPELVARLARQAARLLDVEALSEELEREAETEAETTDTGTVGLRPKAPGAGDTPDAVGAVGATPVTVRREPRRASRIWTIVAAVFVVLGISGTVVKLIDDNARQRDLQGAPAPPGGSPGAPGTSSGAQSSAPPATTTAGPTSAPPPGTATVPPGGQQPGQVPPPAGSSGGSSGGSAGGGTQPRPPATTTTAAPKPAPAPAPAKTTAPSSTGQVPSGFVGTWTYTSAYNIGQPKTVYLYRVAPGQIAARMITEINGAHCEHVAKLVSVTDGGKRVNLGSAILDQARSSGYPSCTNGDASAFVLAVPTGLTHDVGPAHGEGYHYERA
ncbi:serine/threonine protein kinase [Streptomyces sp. SKN60]|uniref:serine/threonine-protein kinase n=1 Tax=Streptomyces sp. SKN60 TaxID=2855506 RepID=UPI002245199E|nr:serine/threonine-protein kinase [Streptomyces sp. SKN60]MCX2180975.1 serine/threonine protein kinase [Streptomyces sp. SKN60]